MLSKLKPKSEFSRNVLTLMTGTTIAQAIPIAISPILTRIYTPDDFGVLALFVAITSIFGTIANGRYELAIMLPKKDEDAINIFALGFIITSVLSLILLILIVIFNGYFTELLNNDEISVWLYFVPVSVFFTGIWNILNYFNNRKKQYKDLAKATIIKSIVIAIIQLSVGLMKQGASGLISGQIISRFFANSKLLANILKEKNLLSKISKLKIMVLAKRYKDFPMFSMWAGLLNTSSHHFTNILISSFYSVSTLGFYSLVQRVLGVPSSLVGNSIGQVFFQQASEEKRRTGKAIDSFNSTIKKLIIIGIPSFGLFFYIIEDLFAFVFGEDWRVAGSYSIILLPYFFMNFISSPLAIIMSVFEKQIQALLINMIILISSVTLILMSDVYHLSFVVFLKSFSIVMFLNYSLFIFYYKSLAKGQI